ncbi:hypothetical protein Tco_0461784 [Tanacetum coccineum]
MNYYPLTSEREDSPTANLPHRLGLVSLGSRSDGDHIEICGYMGITDSWDEIVDLTGSSNGIYTSSWSPEVDVWRGWGRTSDGLLAILAMRGYFARTKFYCNRCKRITKQATVREILRRQRAISDLLETNHRRREEMRELRAADRTRQQQLIQTLTAM